MKFNKISLSCTLVLSSFYANAVQPLVVTGFGPVVTTPLAADVARIQASQALVAASLKVATTNAIAAIHSSGTEASKATLSAATKSVTEGVLTTSLQMKSEMDFLGDIESRKMTAANRIISDETHASVQFVEEFLRRTDVKNLNISEAIEFANKNVDLSAKVVEPPSVLSKVCEDDDNECKKVNNVGFERKFKPSLHLSVYAKLCGVEKRDSALSVAKTRSSNSTNIESARKTQATLSKTSSLSSQRQRIKSNDLLSCTPERVEKSLCGNISKSDYIDKVLKNEIIPDGNVSANNLFVPRSVGGGGVIDIATPEMQDVVKMIEFNALERTKGGKRDIPEIIYTYRNSSQLKAAESFVDNIVNLDALSNQPVSDRKKAGSVDFQTMFLSRAAQLDLVRNTLNQSISERRGEKLSSISMSSVRDENIVKEFDDGAGSLDQKVHNIKMDMEKFSVNNISEMTSMTEGKVLIEIYTALAKKNNAQQERLIKLELQSLLLASLLGAEVNDPENINYMKRVR